MLNKAEVIINDDKVFVSQYNIELMEPDGTSQIVPATLSWVSKTPSFDENVFRKQQFNRIPVTVFK
jgi:hypothetical protein